MSESGTRDFTRGTREALHVARERFYTWHARGFTRGTREAQTSTVCHLLLVASDAKHVLTCPSGRVALCRRGC